MEAKGSYIAKRIFRSIALIATFLFSTPTWALSFSENPSYDGNYYVYHAATGAVQNCFIDCFGHQTCWWDTYYLQESVNGGAWTNIHSNQDWTSTYFSGKAPGTYSYRVIVAGTVVDSGTITVSAPTTPAGAWVSPTASTTGSFTVSWGASSGVSYYQLYEHNGSSWYLLANTGSTSYSRSVGNGVWTYMVRSVAPTGYTSGWSGQASVTVSLPPGTPSSASISPANSSNGSHTVSWGASSGAVTNYDLYRSTNGGGYVHVYTGTSTSVSFSGLGSAYYVYRVRAYNTVNGVISYSGYRYSNTGNVAITPGVPPSATLSPVNSSNGSHSVSWGASSGALHAYQLERSVNGGGYTLVDTTSALSSSFSALSDATYTYRVRAFLTVNGFTSYSGYRYTSTGTIANTPGVPASVTLTPLNSSSGSHDVSWTASTGTVTAYELERSINGGTYTPLDTTSALTSSHSGLADATYAYRVRAYNTVNGFSSYSNYQTSSTGIVANTPGDSATNNTTPSTSHDGSHTVQWDTATGAVSHYELQQSINSAAYTTVYTGTAVAHTLTNLGVGSYTYQVRACNVVSSFTTCGNWVSSTAVNVSLPAATATITGPTDDSDGVYSLSWAAATGAGTYELQENLNGGTWTTIQNTSAVDINLTGKTDGTWNYRVRVCNVPGCSAWSSVLGVVVLLNQAPVATDDTTDTVEDNAITIDVLANDTDADGDPLDITGTTDPNNGVVTHNGVTVTYTPNENYFGVDSFTYTITDGTVSATANVTVNVGTVNDIPVVNVVIPDQLTEPGVEYSYTIAADTFLDAEDINLEYSVSGYPAWLNFDMATMTLTGTPASNNMGTSQITVTATDSSAASASDTFNLTVAYDYGMPMPEGTECERKVETVWTDIGAVSDVVISFDDGGSDVRLSASGSSVEQMERYFLMAMSAKQPGKALRIRYAETMMSCPPPGAERSDILGIWLIYQ